MRMSGRLRLLTHGMVIALLAGTATGALAQGAASGARSDFYGFVMLDMGIQTKQNDPAWFDVIRPTKLPSFDNQYGADGHFYAGVRQTRFGVKSYFPTDIGELKTTFEFELFGTGEVAGQTIMRLRHAYGEIGKFGAGQTWSPFMDIDVFPNSIEYWGPSGMAFYRNVQVRWMPKQGDTRTTIALERPGASADFGENRSLIPLGNVAGHFPLPDLSAEHRIGKKWGYVEGAGILRYFEWEDNDGDPAVDLSGSAVGWGLNLSTNVNIGKGVFRGQFLYGEGIQNYMNDASQDLAVEATNTPAKPFEGVPLPCMGLVAFYDHNWNPKWSSSIGYSLVSIDNIDDQLPDAFHAGHYALFNLLHYPAKNIMLGGELQYGKRENFNDGFTSDDIHLQFSARYNFSTSIGGQ